MSSIITTYVFPQRPLAFEPTLWPARPQAAPTNVRNRQHEQWGDANLDIGALRSIEEPTSNFKRWEVLTGNGWTPYDEVAHLGIIRMYGRFGLHSHRGMTHQEPEFGYIRLSKIDPVTWPPLPWIWERMPIRPDELCLEDISLDPVLRNKVAQALAKIDKASSEEEQNNDDTQVGIIVSPTGDLRVTTPPVDLTIVAGTTGLEKFAVHVDTSRVNVAQVVFPPMVGRPASMFISPTRIVGSGNRTLRIAWLPISPDSPLIGKMFKSYIEIGTGSPDNKTRVPITIRIVKEATNPEPPPTPAPSTLPPLSPPQVRVQELRSLLISIGQRIKPTDEALVSLAFRILGRAANNSILWFAVEPYLVEALQVWRIVRKEKGDPRPLP